MTAPAGAPTPTDTNGTDNQTLSTAVNKIFRQALAYYDAGLNVIPLRYGRKEPIPGFNLSAYFEKRATKEQVIKWFEGDQKYNVGLVMGNGIFALDLDGQDSLTRLRLTFCFDEPYKERTPEGEVGILYEPRSAQAARVLEYLAWSMRTLTGGGGRHVILGYRSEDIPDQIHTQTLWRGIGEHSEIKVKGKNSYIVKAPSLHPNGSGYQLSDYTGVHVMIMTKQDLQYMFYALSGNSKSISEKKRHNRRQKKNNDVVEGDGDGRETNTKALTPKEMQAWLAAIEPRYKRANRNQIVVGLSGVFYKEGYAEAAALRFISVLSEKCSDEEKQARLDIVKRTYAKDKSDVAGWTLLDFS